MRRSLINLAVGITMGLGGQLASADTLAINPFVDAVGYVNPDYKAEVEQFFSSNKDYQDKALDLGLLNNDLSWKISTAIWLDSIQAISGYQEKGRTTRSLLDYLKGARDESVKQGGKPVVVSLVIYDLPLRDCAAYSSNGELGKDDLEKYQKEYIGKIKGIFDDFYNKEANAKNVRLALVIEPDSLPNLLTNTSIPKCQDAAPLYLQGISYALEKFSGRPDHIFMYLDIAHSGWLGWPDNANRIASVYSAEKLGLPFNNVRGFITNTSNYTPLKEGFSYDEYLPFYGPGTNPSKWIITTDYYGYNGAYDELSYVAEIMSLQASNDQLNRNDQRILAPKGDAKYKDKHFLIDTSRNGWILNTKDYLGFDQQKKAYPYPRRDQRHHRGNWCNVQNVIPTQTVYDNPDKKLIPTKSTSAGLGQIPTANPAPINPLYGNAALPIDAYVWIKPPGESDGFFDSTKICPPGDKACGDHMCGTAKVVRAKGELVSTDSLQMGTDRAPSAGQFFPAAFKNLIDTAVKIKAAEAEQQKMDRKTN